jgi:hypothetical protein
MKNVVFWDIKTQFVPHRRHITSPLQSPASYCYVRFEVFTAVSMRNAVFWDVTRVTRRNIPEDFLQDIGCLHSAGGRSIAEVSEVHSAYFFRVEACGI